MTSLPRDRLDEMLKRFDMIEATMADGVDGETYARPIGDPDLEKALSEPILIEVEGKKTADENDRILVKLKKHHDGPVTGKLMRNLGEVITKTIAGFTCTHG